MKFKGLIELYNIYYIIYIFNEISYVIHFFPSKFSSQKSPPFFSGPLLQCHDLGGRACGYESRSHWTWLFNERPWDQNRCGPAIEGKNLDRSCASFRGLAFVAEAWCLVCFFFLREKKNTTNLGGTAKLGGVKKGWCR